MGHESTSGIEITAIHQRKETTGGGPLPGARPIPDVNRSPAGLEISSQSDEALSPAGFGNLCDEVEAYLNDPDASIVERNFLGGGLNGSYIATERNRLLLVATRKQYAYHLGPWLEPTHLFLESGHLATR